MNQARAIVLHRNMRADPDSFLKAIAPFGQDIVVAVECIFTW
ncbi:MAG: IS110 family transposase, partial [Acidobacteria bacterium]